MPCIWTSTRPCDVVKARSKSSDVTNARDPSNVTSARLARARRAPSAWRSSLGLYLGSHSAKRSSAHDHTLAGPFRACRCGGTFKQRTHTQAGGRLLSPPSAPALTTTLSLGLSVLPTLHIPSRAASFRSLCCRASSLARAQLVRFGIGSPCAGVPHLLPVFSHRSHRGWTEDSIPYHHTTGLAAVLFSRRNDTAGGSMRRLPTHTALAQ